MRKFMVVALVVVVVAMLSVVVASAADPAGPVEQIPTPDPQLLETEVGQSGVNVNAIWPFMGSLLAIGAGFLLLSIALKIAPRVVKAIRNMVG